MSQNLHRTRRRAHVLFASIPAHGHINPGLGLVAELVERGHRVSYATTDEFTAQVTDSGAEPVRYDSLLPGTSGAQRSEWPDDELTAQRLFLDETDLVLPQLERALADDRPDVIVYDVAAFAGLVLAEKWRIPRIQLSPTYVFSPGIEQVLGMTQDTAGKREVRARYDRYFAAQGVGLAFQDIAVPQRAIVTIPRGFQYFGDEVEDSFEFVGPMLSERAFQGGWSPPDDRPVLVISLGSAYNDRRDFYRRCLEAFGGMDRHVVLSVGRGIDPAELGEAPENFEIHQWIPQLKVLSHADAFLTHAGMGGVMEGLHHGVPLIAAPQAVEQFANADRIEQLSLGVQVDSGTVSPDELRDALSKVTKDPDIRWNVDRMQQEIRESGGLTRAADRVESLLEG